jgi:heme-degrading monooxygenase HmoA
MAADTASTTAAALTRPPAVITAILHRFAAERPCQTADVDEQSITVFRSRLRDGCPIEQYSERARGLEARAAAAPGFVEFKEFVAADGERLALVTFESARDEATWRDDPDHRAAQQEGRDDFYAEYDVAVCAVQRRHRWARREPR